MKSTGIVRKVDELGRVAIPIELRRTMQIAEKDPLEIYVDGEKIILKSPSLHVSSAGTLRMSVFTDKNIQSCLDEMKTCRRPRPPLAAQSSHDRRKSGPVPDVNNPMRQSGLFTAIRPTQHHSCSPLSVLAISLYSPPPTILVLRRSPLQRHVCLPLDTSTFAYFLTIACSEAESPATPAHHHHHFCLYNQHTLASNSIPAEPALRRSSRG